MGGEFEKFPPHGPEVWGGFFSSPLMVWGKHQNLTDFLPPMVGGNPILSRFWSPPHGGGRKSDVGLSFPAHHEGGTP